MARTKLRASAQILAGTITSALFAAGAVDNAALAADAVDGSKMADNAVDSEHINAGAVDNDHLAGSIAAAKLDLADTYNFSGTLQKGGVAVATTDDITAATEGLTPKAAMQLATTAALPACSYNAGVITADDPGALSVDGSSPAVGWRILVKDQAAGGQNGLYTVTDPGDESNPFVLTRASDANTAAEIPPGTVCFVDDGATNGNRTFISANFVATLGTDDPGFVDFATTAGVKAGTGLTKSGNSLSITAGGVTGTELNSNVAGNGIQGGGGSPLDLDIVDTKPVYINGTQLDFRVTGALGVDGGGNLKLDNGGQAISSFSSEFTTDGGGVHRIAIGGIATAMLAAGAVDAAALATAVAGGGLTGGGGAALAVEMINAVATDSGDQTTYTVAAGTIMTGYELVFLNTTLQRSGAGNDYQMSGSDIVFESANTAGDVVQIYGPKA